MPVSRRDGRLPPLQIRLFGLLGGLIVGGLIVQALRARGRTLRLGLNQLRVFFRVVHAQTVPLRRALLRI